MTEEHYTPLALKYRPQRFSEIVGQQTTLRVLRGMITRHKIGAAYLFCGPKGSGKTTTARIFAKALNCQSPKGVEPCCICRSCEDITNARSADCVELDSASAGSVSNARAMREASMHTTISGRRRIWILDEVHNTSREGFNALLKIMEEPPPGVVFILCSTERHRIPETIISRCYDLPFTAIATKDIDRRLHHVLDQEKIQTSKQALTTIAARANGSIRDALTLVDTLTAIHGNDLTHTEALKDLGLDTLKTVGHLLQLATTGNKAAAIKAFRTLWNDQPNSRLFVESAAHHLYNTALVHAGLDCEIDPRELQTAKQLAASQSGDTLKAIERLESALSTTRIDPQTLIEMWLAGGLTPPTTSTKETSLKELWETGT